MKSTRSESPAWPAKLLGLVDYQQDAIVSRILVQGPGGSVTVFAFDQGQRLSEHTAPFDALGRGGHLDAGPQTPCARGPRTFQDGAHHDPLMRQAVVALMPCTPQDTKGRVPLTEHCAEERIGGARPQPVSQQAGAAVIGRVSEEEESER